MSTIKSVTITKISKIFGAPAASLVRAVSRAHGNFSDFKDIAEDVCGHGANTGISFIYTAEGAEFFRHYRKMIRSVFAADAEAAGDSNLLGYVYSFRGLEDFDQMEIAEALFTNGGECADQIQCVFAYAAVEMAARYIVDAAEYDD